LEGYEPLPRLIPKRKPHTCKTLNEREPAGTAEFGMVAQDSRQPIEGNAATQMVHMVNANIGSEPAHDDGQIVV
jgi:hypothetical protein